MISSGTGDRSEARRSSKRVVPVHSRSMLGAPPSAASSSRWAVRKSMLKRDRPEEFGTDECRWAPENRIRPPGGQTTELRLQLQRSQRLRLLAGVRLDLLR